ncbi:MAG: riboflavin biosynthesis protein RibD [Marinoscillum sp.]|nr:riboflavin biosynthesis protein RibD [Marinoscillum sp.]|tara:strand:- start:1299 stop:2339 length:1041 start_codon:yes stop_codon:yes gene_type:complete
MIKIHKKYIERTFYLAKKGLGGVRQNPLVGCVIVKEDKIIGEGYHKKYGEKHAEINAIDSVKDKEDIKGSSIYINLEPCSHYGKTPPCVNELIRHEPKEVIISNRDPNIKVNGNGINALEANGIKVIEEIKRREGEDLNKRFFTNQNKKRPYVILKWAQTEDGYMAREDGSSQWISNAMSRKLVHKWRSEEIGICVGIDTAILDNPKLNVRKWYGEDPIRVIINPKNKSLNNKKVLHDNLSTFVMTEEKDSTSSKKKFFKLNRFSFKSILEKLFDEGVSTLIVEGGSKTINYILKDNLWDEARIFIGKVNFKKGTKAPDLKIRNKHKNINGDKLHIILNDEGNSNK